MTQRRIDTKAEPAFTQPVLALIVTSMDERWPFPLQRALDSALEQTRKPDYILISRALPGEDCGQQKQRAVQSLPAEVEWIAFLDDDDWLYPEHLERLEAQAEATGADMVYPWFEFDRPSGRGHDIEYMMFQPFDEEEMRKNNYIPVTVLIKRSTLVAAGGFQKIAPPVYDDWALWLRLCDQGAKIVHLPEKTWMWTTRHSVYIHQEPKDA